MGPARRSLDLDQRQLGRRWLSTRCRRSIVAAPIVSLRAQPVESPLLAALRWRHVGPFRGGRTVGAAGVPQQPNVFYVGANNGGVVHISLNRAGRTLFRRARHHGHGLRVAARIADRDGPTASKTLTLVPGG